MSTGFWKMTGSGNDFVMVDGRRSPAAEWPRERIVAACDRRNGAGADGLVVLTPEGRDTVRMLYHNSDGSAAAMCGNAALCSTRLAARLGMAGSEMQLLTPAGVVRSRCIGEGWDAEINLGASACPHDPGIPLAAGEDAILLGSVGVPHLVVFVRDVAAVDVARRGRELRHHPAVAPAGANVNFVGTPPGSSGRWLIRTFERGVEAETLACGTGTVAAAIGLAVTGRGDLPAEFQSWGGLPLSVRARLSGTDASDIWLQGQGRLVYEGSFEAL